MPIPKAFVAAITRKPPSMKLCWMFFFSSGWQSGVEAIGVDVQGGEERSDLLGPPPRRAVHDRPACCLRRQMPGQELVDVVELLGAGGLGHDELQIRAPAAAVEHRHLDVEVTSGSSRRSPR